MEATIAVVFTFYMQVHICVRSEILCCMTKTKKNNTNAGI